MLQCIWIILVLIAASGWAFAETADDVRTREKVLQMLDNAQTEEIVFQPGKKLLVLRGVQFGKGRAGEVNCDLDRKALTIIIRDHELQTDDRWGVRAFECRVLIERLRARGQLP